MRFEDVKRLEFIGAIQFEDGYEFYNYNIDLIFNGGSERIFTEVNLEITKIGAKICEEIGVNGYYIDEKKNSTVLGSPSGDSYEKAEVTNNSMLNQILSLKQGWEGDVK